MKIQLLSDLHREVFRKCEEFSGLFKFVKSDILVLAGDIADFATFAEAIKCITQGYREVNPASEIICITGNHEFYRSPGARQTFKLVEGCCKQNGVTFLNNRVFPLEGHRILGTPLWYPYGSQAEQCIDHYYIKPEEISIYEMNIDSCQFLNENVQSGDIVVSHFCPLSFARRGKNAYEFDGTDMESLIHASTPALWLFGHTHDSFDAQLGKTRLIANPYGYHKYLPNRNFQNPLLIEV